MTQHTLTVDAVDMEALAEALADGNRDRRWWFHTETGDVRPSGDWADGFADEDLEEQGWVPVPPTGGRAGFEDMELFTQAVGDVRARDVLQAALAGKGVFRRFRDTLREFPDLKEAWLTWVTAREDLRAIRWLLQGGFVDELDAEAASVARREAAAGALDAVRRTGGSVFDVAEVPGRWTEVLAALDRGTPVTLTRDGRAYAAVTRFDPAV